MLDGARRSVELDRAREIRPLIDTVDVLFDLHSMLWPSDPLILCGTSPKGKRLAFGAGVPGWWWPITAMPAAGGSSTIRALPTAATAVPPALWKPGSIGQSATVDTMLASVAGLLRHLGWWCAIAALPEAGAATAAAFRRGHHAVIPQRPAISPSCSPYRGGDVIPRRNTLIALDGETEIRTPYDDCLLIMPSLRPSRGHTAVRLARFVDA